MRALIVEDDQRLAKNTAILLKKKLQMSVDVAFSGKEGRKKFQVNDYDVVILDWMLGDASGIDLCAEFQKTKAQVAIIMVTARNAISDKLQGFSSGADDYLSKPFLMEELIARIQAVTRRKFVPNNKPILTFGSVELNTSARKLTVFGKEIILAPKEYALFEYLAIHAGEVVGREDLLEHAWDENAEQFNNSVDVHISNIRNKIGAETEIIKTVRGKGYVIYQNPS